MVIIFNNIKRIILFALISILLISCITIVGVVNVLSDTPAEQEPYIIELENSKKFFYMAPDSGFVKNKKYENLQSGLYYNTTPPQCIYNVDFKSNPSKQYPWNYAYENIIISSDGTYFVDIPWAVTVSYKYDDEGNLINFDEIAMEAISFYKNGIHLKTYSVSDLLKDISKARFSVSHVQWENYQKREFDPKYNLLKITTNDDILYMFDITTGKIVDSTDNLTAVPTSPTKVTVLPFNYFPTWNGTGTLSMKINGYNYENFSHLKQYSDFIKDGKIIDSSNYTVSGTNEFTEIIFKEKYLKTLSDDNYSFNAVFFGIEEFQMVSLDNSRTDYSPYLVLSYYPLTDKPFIVHDIFYLEDYFIDYTIKNKMLVDKDNYTYTLDKTDWCIQIFFNEDYKESLPKELLYFEVLYSSDTIKRCTITIAREDVPKTGITNNISI